MAVVMTTFKLSAFPCIGILTKWSAFFLNSSFTPPASSPTTRANGVVKLALKMADQQLSYSLLAVFLNTAKQQSAHHD